MAQLSLASIASRTAESEVEIGLDETLSIVYRPQALSLADEMRLRAIGEDTEKTKDLVDMIAKRVLVSWGLLGPMEDAEGNKLANKGSVVPVTAAALLAIPSSVFVAIVQATLSGPKATTTA